VPTVAIANFESAPFPAANFGEFPRSTFTLSTVGLEAMVNQVLPRFGNTPKLPVLEVFMCHNYPLTSFLLANYMNSIIDLSLSNLVLIYRIPGQARHLELGIELGECSSFHPYTFPLPKFLPVSLHHHHPLCFATCFLVMHLHLGYNY
jgi:hypothetical protein